MLLSLISKTLNLSFKVVPKILKITPGRPRKSSSNHLRWVCWTPLPILRCGLFLLNEGKGFVVRVMNRYNLF